MGKNALATEREKSSVRSVSQFSFLPLCESLPRCGFPQPSGRFSATLRAVPNAAGPQLCPAGRIFPFPTRGFCDVDSAGPRLFHPAHMS